MIYCNDADVYTCTCMWVVGGDRDMRCDWGGGRGVEMRQEGAGGC